MKKILSAVLITILILQSFIFAVSAEETRLWLTLDSVDLKTGSLCLVTENGSFITADNTSTQELSPGESAWVTINENNDITAIEKIPYYDLELGYMSQIVSGTYSSGAEYLRITVFKDKKLTFDLSSEIMLNGEKANASGTYSVLSAFEGAIAYKYDSEINKITEIYTLETPAQSLSEAVFNPETGSFDELNYPVTVDTITLFVDGKGGLSSVNFEADCLYGLSVYGYDKDYNAKLVVVNEISYSDVLFYKGEITAKSGNKYYLNAYDTENSKKSILISDSCALNGEEFSDIPALYEALGSFEGLIEISSDVKGNINKINTLTSGVAFKNIEYNANANIIGEYNLYETKYFMVKDIFKSGENTFNTVHKWNNMDELSENYTYSGTFYETASGKYLWINDKTPISGYLPETDYGIRYNEKAKIFTAFLNVSKNSYAGDATIVVCAYENSTLIDSDYVETKKLTEDTKYISAACTLSDGKSLKDYTFKYYMLDKALNTLEVYPVFTGKDAAENNETNSNREGLYITGLVVSNGAVSITAAGGTDIKLDAAPEVAVKLIDTHNSNHDEFSAYKFQTITEMERENVVKKFLAGNSDISDYVGKKVNLWLSEDENTGKFTVLACEPHVGSNQTVTFTLDQFASYDGNKEIEYFKDGANDETTVKLQNGDDTVVVYNNYGLGEGHIDDVFGTGNPVAKDSTYGGKVTLIDNDTKSGYDVVFVEVGATAVVDEVNGNRVLFKESAVIPTVGGGYHTLSAISVDNTATDRIVKIFKGKKEISVSELSEWDVLSITAASKYADYIICEVIDKALEGTISGTMTSKTSAAQVDAQGNGIAFRIGNKFYDVVENAYKAEKLQIGDTGLFYIDKYGKIVAFKEYDDPTTKYGFVLNAALDTAGVNDGVFQVKMLTENGEKTYNFATKVSYYYAGDETRYTIESDCLIPSTFLTTNKNKLIKYITNASGEINTVYEAGYDDEKFDEVKVVDGTPVAWDADNVSFKGQAVDEDATIFFLSTTMTGNNGSYVGDITINGRNYDLSTSDSFIGTIADLDDNECYNFIAYRTSTGDDANLIVVTTGYGNTGATSNIAVLTQVYTAQNAEYEDVYVLNYYKDGELQKEVITTNNVYVSNQGDLSVGDIVKVKSNKNGIITGLTLIVDFDDDIRNADGTIDIARYSYVTHAGVSESWDFGYVNTGNYTKSTKTVKINGNSYKLSNAENVYVIDGSLLRNKVHLGSAVDYEHDDEMANSIRAKYADYIFVRKYSGAVKDVVIVKNIIDNYYNKPDYKTADEEALEEALDEEADAATAVVTATTTFETATTTFEAATTAYETALATWETSAKDYNAANLMNMAVEVYNEAVYIYNEELERLCEAAEQWYDIAMLLAELDDYYDCEDAIWAYENASAIEPAFEAEYVIPVY